MSAINLFITYVQRTLQMHKQKISRITVRLATKYQWKNLYYTLSVSDCESLKSFDASFLTLTAATTGGKKKKSQHNVKSI